MLLTNLKRLFKKKYLLYLLKTVKYFCIYPLANIIKINKKYQNIWLISERGKDARDNGYHLFKFIRTNYPDVKIYFVISKNSADRFKVEKLGNIINYGSIKHYFYFIFAQKLISTHIMGYSPDMTLFWWLAKRNLLGIKGKRIFIRHGIIKDYMVGCTSKNTKLDLFVCGAKPEYDYVISKYGHPAHTVKYLGLSRYDNLNHINARRYILVMPTFRMWLLGNDPPSEKQIKQFNQSAFYERYNKLLNNKELESLLVQNQIKLVFYPHYEFQKYIGAFKQNRDTVHIAEFGKYDVQQLLKESLLLITDYSSVYFDFAYMQKPVIYYQFDYENYRQGHYDEGYFNYERDGFGPVCYDEKRVIDEIKAIIKNDFRMMPTYLDRTKDFFPLRDTDNCKRNYEAIANL